MKRKTAQDFHPKVLKLFDQYVHGELPRREFLASAAKFTLLGVSAEVLLETLNPNFAEAQQIKGDDPRISASFVEYTDAPGYGKIRGYFVKPAHIAGKLPTVLVVHENRGLNPHIEDIARRIALDNFIVFAPDALFPLGGYPGDEDKAREKFKELDQAKTKTDFVFAAGLLKSQPEANGKVGAVGFCYGGGIVNYLATEIIDLAAGVAFYGAPPKPVDVKKIKAPLQLHYAGEDERINANWPAYETALKAAATRYEAYIYPGVQHGFNNDTTPRYDEKAAKLAWERTIGFFNKQLRT